MAGSKGRKGAPGALPNIHMTKKCPECFTYLPLNAKACHSCGLAVGSVNKLGLAERPPNIKGYIVAALAVLAFVFFVWWGWGTE